MECAQEHAMPIPRSLYLVAGAIAASVGLCVSAMAPLAGVLAGTIAVGLVMLVSTAAALLAAAIYLRVSTGRQAEQDLSIPDQRAQTKAWAARRGWTVVAEYVEPVASATSAPSFRG